MLTVWLHGWATDNRVFGPLTGALAGIPGLRTVAPSLSHWLDPACPYGWGESLARRLADEAQGNEPLLLCGWSMGALLALEAALRLGRRVVGLLIFSGCSRFVRDSANQEGQDPRVLRLMQRRLAVEPELVLRDFHDMLFAPDEAEARKRFSLELEPPCLELPKDWLSAGLDYLLLTDLRPTLPDIRVPSLIVHGAADRVIAPGLGKSLALNLPEARFVDLDSAGHLPFWPDSRRMDSLVSGFIAHLMGTRSEND